MNQQNLTEDQLKSLGGVALDALRARAKGKGKGKYPEEDPATEYKEIWKPKPYPYTIFITPCEYEYLPDGYPDGQTLKRCGGPIDVTPSTIPSKYQKPNFELENQQEDEREEKIPERQRRPAPQSPHTSRLTHKRKERKRRNETYRIIRQAGYQRRIPSRP